MARKKSDTFRKMLEVIGLVDDEDTREPMDEGYSDDGYGRQQAYVPQQRSRMDDPCRRAPADARASQRYAPQPRRRSNPFVERVEDDRSAYRGGSSRGQERYGSDRYGSDRYGEDRYASRQSSAARQRPSRFDDPEEAPRNSRFSDQPSGRAGQESAPTPRENRSAQRQRTVMFSLHSLEDCCEVIDNLISNNTVVLTLDELDAHMMQRAVDTLSGAVFALHATIRKASDRTYLIAPSSVEVNESDDLQRRY